MVWYFARIPQVACYNGPSDFGKIFPNYAQLYFGIVIARPATTKSWSSVLSALMKPSHGIIPRRFQALPDIPLAQIREP
jgi:hypothetical protein